jgi:DNA-binding MarR family transcriptional regulator
MKLAFFSLRKLYVLLTLFTEKTTSVADHLHSAAIHLLRWIRSQDESLGLSPARLSALSVIVFGGPVSLNDLAKVEQVKPPTMSRLIDALERGKFVTRKTDDNDKRAILICATEKGSNLLRHGRKKRVQFLARQMNVLLNDDLAHLESAADIISKKLLARSP